MLILKVFLIFLPWRVKRFFLIKFFNYELHPSASIGFSWVYPLSLIMEEGSKINHFTVAIHLDKLMLRKFSSINRSNWITGFPSGTNSSHFKHQEGRISELILGDYSSITKKHHIDCTNSINIGRFVTVAGYNSQFLTHSINIYDCRQDSAPIIIGDYCFIGTNSVILGGAKLPSYCVLGAKSLLNKYYSEEWTLYAGLPAIPKSKIPRDAKYFSRSIGFIN